MTPGGGRLQIGIGGRLRSERVADFIPESVAGFKSESLAGLRRNQHWRTLDVFGMHATKPEERLDAAGLVWCIGGADVLAITSCMARLQHRPSVSLSFRRNETEHPEATAIWAHELSGVPARAK